MDFVLVFLMLGGLASAIGALIVLLVAIGQAEPEDTWHDED